MHFYLHKDENYILICIIMILWMKEMCKNDLKSFVMEISILFMINILTDSSRLIIIRNNLFL